MLDACRPDWTACTHARCSLTACGLSVSSSNSQRMFRVDDALSAPMGNGAMALPHCPPATMTSTCWPVTRQGTANAMPSTFDSPEGADPRSAWALRKSMHRHLAGRGNVGLAVSLAPGAPGRRRGCHRQRAQRSRAGVRCSKRDHYCARNFAKALALRMPMPCTTGLTLPRARCPTTRSGAVKRQDRLCRNAAIDSRVAFSSSRSIAASRRKCSSSSIPAR